MKDNIIHLAIQIVPLTRTKHPYEIIDKAIEVIAASKLPYQVGAMETVLQGTYAEVMDVARKAQEKCFAEGADELVITMKVHARKDGDVSWDEKLHKYS